MKVPVGTVVSDMYSGEVLAEPFHVFEAPDAYLAENKSYPGTRFTGDGIYRR